MIVFDASVVIALLDVDDALHSRAQRLLAGLVDRPFFIQVITLSEVLVGPTRRNRLRLAEEQLAAMGLRVLGLAEDRAAELADLRVRTGLKLPDCCVLLAARSIGAAVGTFDDRLARAGQALGIPIESG